MNVKDTHELLELLDEIRQEAINLRSACDIESLEDTGLKEYFLNTAAKAGIRASRLDYFIRLIEEIVVIR